MSETPDLTRKVIGFRSWGLNADATLGSAGKQTIVWGRGRNEARCEKRLYQSWRLESYYMSSPFGGPRPPKPDLRSCDHAPAKGCDCGLYALHQMPEPWLCGAPFTATPSHAVHGAITAWGRMEVHKDGFRAECAQIIALAFHPDWPISYVEAIGSAAENYAVPALPLAELADFAATLGEALPTSLYPDVPPVPPSPPVAQLAPSDPKLTYQAQLYQAHQANAQANAQLALKKKKWWKP